MSQQFHHIPGLLKPEELTLLSQLTERISFVDGKATASMAARDVKNNLQTDMTNAAALLPVQQLLEQVLQTSPYFQAAAQPKKTHPFIISKYGPGNYYGWHVDSPIMGNPPLRTDLAMTIFLSDPSTYEGGELLIQTDTGTTALKPAAGDAILYPCQFIHCVNEIKSGVRMAAITWVQSNIQSAEQRQLLFQLGQVQGLLQQKDKHAPETNILLQAHANLFRMWADV